MSDASQPIWHTLSVEEIMDRLNTDASAGLSSALASERLGEVGPNRLTAVDTVSPWSVFFGQFKNILIIILLIAVVFSIFLGHALEAGAITIILLFAVILGFVQEFRAERAMAALRKMAAPTATVLRDGTEVEIAAENLVPGDILLLTTGDRIPADARLVESVNLKIEEAALTGESVPVEKHALALENPSLALGDRRNMVYASTAASYGRGVAVVVATGMSTEMGKIAGLLQSVTNTETPLQKNLDVMGKRLAQAALIVVALIVALGLARGQSLVQMILFGIALAVAVVPEALPAVVTISLAIGVQRMVKRHALVRRLSAVETLGCTTVICTDKTGTLTRDEMTVRKIFSPVHGLVDVTGAGYDPHGSFLLADKPLLPENGFLELLKAGALASDARLIKDSADGWGIKGDPTEGALVVVAAKAGLHKEQLDSEFERVGEIPFSSETKSMLTLHQSAEGSVAYCKGALEAILPLCAESVTASGETASFTAEESERVMAVAHELAASALRVIAVASKTATALSGAQSEMTFLGLFAMIDPPRAEAKEAIALCRTAGIKLKMITGDHPLTAAAIARELGLLSPQGRVVTGVELETWSVSELAKNIEAIEVFARVSPAHKLRVIEALQTHGHIVAMTGDGVNDAPALKKADIGIAMGITGTDVAKEAADMLLLDDNFASIVAAIEEGRLIFGNIKKFLMYLLSSNIGEIGLMTITSLFGFPLPLTAVQILYVNLATDGLPALALAVDPADHNLMQAPPRKQGDGIFSRRVVMLMLVGGAWSTIVTVSLFGWLLHTGRALAEVMTMVFVTLVLIEFCKAFIFRSEHKSMFTKIFSNQWLNRAMVWELTLLAVVVFVPWFHAPLNTFSLSVKDIGIVVSAAATIIVILEITKILSKKMFFDSYGH